MKNKILFVYPDMILGGSTTALIALLKKLDYEKNQVDLLFLNNGNYRTDEIPGQVNILPDAAKENLSGAKARIKKRFHLLFSGNIFRVLAWALKNKPSKAYFIAALNQALAQANAGLSRPLEEKYDLAVAFLEMWPTVYLAKHIDAKKKIAWVHIDYQKARFCAALDKKFYGKTDRIICVSDGCKESFDMAFPQFADKTCRAENEIDTHGIISKSGDSEGIEAVFSGFSGFRIVTVARIDAYTKGIDRIINICERLKSDGLIFRWFIIGYGPDFDKMNTIAKEKQLSDCLVFLGARNNPYPYIKNADLLVLASRNEGKPITVSEALILSTPVLVTEYAAAKKQICGGGIVVPNEDMSIYPVLSQIIRKEIILSRKQILPPSEGGAAQLIESILKEK